MKTTFTLVFVFLSLVSFTQVSLTGSSSSIAMANNAPAAVVDNAITITGSVTIDGARVSIAANFSTGDVLGFTTASLPSAVTGNYSSSTGILTFAGNATASQYQALLRTVTFNTTSSVTTQRTVLFNLGNAIAFSGNNHFYEFITGAYSWTTAKANAAAKTFYGLHGYLATITSQAENDFIQQKTSADGWIGASDDYSQINAATGKSTYSSQSGFIKPAEGKWYWVTGPDDEIGTQFSKNNDNPVAVNSNFMNWNDGEPNNSSTENYGEIYSSGSTAGKWNDLGSSNTLGYVVEYGGMSNDPAVVLTSNRKITMIATELITSVAVVPYTLNSSAVLVDNGVIYYSAASVTDARITISDNFKTGDVLSVTGSLPGGITSSYNSSTGVMSFTGTATPAQWQTVFRSVKFNSTSTYPGDRDITFSAGNLVATGNGHFYEHVSTAGSWTTAKSSAAAKTYLGLHGYLATITSQDENDFITQKLAADAWIGASDDYSQINAATGATTFASQTTAEGKWYWVTGPAGETGTKFSTGNSTPIAAGSMFSNWNSGEPNNAGSSEHYGQIYASGVNPGKWNDLPNSSSLGYVVEYGGLASDPLLYLSATRTISINAPLPITGMQFSGEKDGTATNLRWSTQTEINTLRYDIQHSAGGNNFVKIGELKAAGNSDVLKTYQWTDKQPVGGINYYRIQQFDRDGRYTYSEVKVVVFAGERVQLAPNPANSSITITLDGTTSKGAVRILDMNGRPVIKTKLEQNRQTVNIASLQPGVYIAEVETNTLPARVKFIKK